MKRKRHIKTHMMATLTCVTCALLLVVALAFNLSVFGFIRSRVSVQLSSVSQSMSEERGEEMRGRKEPNRFDGHPDRVMGTRGSAVLLNGDGSLRSNLHGDDSDAVQLAAWVQAHGAEQQRNKVVFLGDNTYAVSVLNDPVETDKLLLIYVDVTSIMAFTKQINVMLLFVVLAAVLLSLLLSRKLARSFSAPVQSLSEFAGAIGNGELSQRELHFRDEEFDALAGAMNRMAADLGEARQKQEVFFQNVSHELRTPLTSIRGNAEGIVYGLMEPRQAATVILHESDKLGGMVEDILWLSRAGKEKPKETAQPLDLREVFSLCVSEQRAEAQAKGLVFRFDFDEAPVLLPIREQDAQRLIGNLISNAIRYAKKEITLSCHQEADGICAVVADDGPGVSAEDLPHVFERMYKGNGGKHGIGLAIAQTVAESCGGRITVRNENGAVFEARFPR